ncbi:MAG: alpha/beta fold hydrolase [Proteobacteria bacterium]|nr:alpha/beta fold hydrolase [Pseudomonadota bacterium]
MIDHSFYLQGSREKGVLLVHGLTGAPTEMRFVGKQLHRMGFTVYAPTLAGHGGDEATLINTTYEDWAAGLQKALSYVKERVSNVSAAGICVGGALALHLAHQEKGRIDKVVIYAPALDYDGWNQPYWSRGARIFKDLLIRIPSVRNTNFKETHPFGVRDDRIRRLIVENPESLEGVLPYFPARSLYQNYRLNDVLKKELPKINVPTLLIHAKDDDVSHPRNSYAIQKQHGGSCDVVLLEDSYHMIHVDRERHKVAELTGQFFGVPEKQVTHPL